MFCRQLMLSTCRTFSVGLLLASKRFLIYCSVRMPHLQNCVKIRSLAGLGMVRGGCGQCRMSALGKKELGERDVVFKWRWCTLLLCWQPFWHTGCRGLPVSLPGLTLGDLWFLVLPGLCQVSPAVHLR